MQTIESLKIELLKDGVEAEFDKIVKYLELILTFYTKTPKVRLVEIENLLRGNSLMNLVYELKKRHERFKNLLKLSKIIDEHLASKETITAYSKGFNALKKHFMPEVQAHYKMKLERNHGNASLMLDFYGNYFKLHQIKQEYETSKTN